MYEIYSRQSFPSKTYRELLGTALCAFNSNNQFVIENILSSDSSGNHNWHELTDLTSGQLSPLIKTTITKHASSEIFETFDYLIEKRNRIIHSFQISLDDGEQILCTKDRNNLQYHITIEYLEHFISENSDFSMLLHEYRGH